MARGRHSARRAERKRSARERLEPAFAQLSVWDAQGARVDLRDVRVLPEDPAQLSVSLPALARGTYTVKFRVLSVDGHVAEGQFSFVLRGSR